MTLLAASVLVVVSGAPASAADFQDTFDRANSTDLGDDWTELATTDLAISGNAATNPNATSAFAQANDVVADVAVATIVPPAVGNAGAYAAIAVDVNSTDDMVFVKAVDSDGDGTFDEIVGLRGNNAGGVIFDESVSEFTTARLSVTSDGHHVEAEVDTGGTSDPEITVQGTNPTDTTGNGTGIGIRGGASIDLFGTFHFGAETTTVVTASPTPSTFGQSVNITATVTPASGSDVATGSIVFTIDNGELAPRALSNGQAVLTTSDLSIGTHDITARYEPDSFAFHASTSTTVQHTVGKATTTLTLVSDHEPGDLGQELTFTATVGAVNTIPAPDGHVTFTVDSETPVDVDLTNGVATLKRSDLPLGTHTVKASYAGSTNYAAAADKTITQHVNRITTSTQVVSDNNPSDFGEDVTFTATVTGTGGAPVTTGTVTFATGGSALGADVGVDSNGQASITVSNLNPGSHEIFATYNQSATTNSSNGTVTQVVNKGASAVAVAASPTPSVSGQSVTFTATVTADDETPTGTVTFKEGATVLAQDVALDADGKATFTTSSLSVGDHTITVEYGGDAALDGSSGQTIHTVAKADTTTAIQSSDEPAASGDEVTYTITVSPSAPGAGTPSGVVHVSANGEAPQDVALDNGVATLQVQFDTTGTFPITVVYDGDAAFDGSSGSLNQTVIEAFTTTTITSSETDNVSSYGQPVTFTVTVTANGAATADGSVELFDGDTSLGTAPMANAPVSFEIAGLTVGDHGLKAVFSGATATSPSSSGTLVHSVVQSETTVTVTDGGGFAINVSVARPDAASASASAGPATTSPSGAIKVEEDGKQIGSGSLTDAGTAQVTMQTLSAGSHNLTVTYAGDTNNKPATATFQKTVSEATAAGQGGAGTGAAAVARTGTNSGPLVFGGILLVTAGAVAIAGGTELRRRRRRPIPSRLA